MNLTSLKFGTREYKVWVKRLYLYRRALKMCFFPGIVRRPPPKSEAGSEPQPDLTPCPYCSTEVLESELYCSSCKSSLPYCVATGYHVVGNDLTACPQCRFPAFRSQMLKLAQVSNG